MKEPVFDAHVHYLQPVPVRQSVENYKEIFELENAENVCFLSVPIEESLVLDPLQNLKGLYYKKMFEGMAYAFAGLEHYPEMPYEEKADDFLRQVKEYMSVGFDGIKMFEGQPKLRKYTGLALDDEAYDKFYTYLEENEIPVIMHIANPSEYWDRTKVSEAVIKMGRFFDETYPEFDELYAELFRMLDKHPNLHFTLAHWGFMSESLETAERFMCYKNTGFDVTPGGEQYKHMLDTDREGWINFIKKYSDRIRYGADSYNFKKYENWEDTVLYRHELIHNFFETDTEHVYDVFTYRGIKLAPELRDKIYRQNATREFGSPKAIDIDYCIKKAKSLTGMFADGSLEEIDRKAMEEDLISINAAK